MSHDMVFLIGYWAFVLGFVVGGSIWYFVVNRLRKTINDMLNKVGHQEEEYKAFVCKEINHG